MSLGQFGFSFVGATFLIALLVPNLAWARSTKPRDYDPGIENRVLRVFERVGQVLTFAAALIFADTNLRPWSPWAWWLVAAVILMLGYEVGWIRHFASRRTLRDFYRSLLGVPVPLATLPVTAFVLLGVYGHLLPLILAAVLLAVGHVGIHVQHYRALRGTRAREDAAAPRL